MVLYPNVEVLLVPVKMCQQHTVTIEQRCGLDHACLVQTPAESHIITFYVHLFWMTNTQNTISLIIPNTHMIYICLKCLLIGKKCLRISHW